MENPIEWLDAVVLVVLGFGLLATTAWVGHGQRDRAGLYWTLAGALITLDGVVTITNAPTVLVPYSSDAIGPLAGWLAYRGATDFARIPAYRPALSLALAGTLAWILFEAIDATLAMRLIGSGSALAFITVSTRILWRSARTTTQHLFAASWCIPLAIMGFRRLSELAGFQHTDAVAVWLISIAGIILLAISALLERRTEKERHLAEQQRELLRLGTLVGRLGTWTLELDTGKLEWSEEIYKIFGLPEASSMPSVATRLALIAEEDQERVLESLRATIDRRSEADFEYQVLTIQGDPRFVHSRAQYMERPDGIGLIIGTTVDVTSQRNALDELRLYRNELEMIVEQRTAQLEESQRRLLHKERLASLGTLTAGLAHQVNNPVGSILAAADFASRCEGDEDELQVLRVAIADIGHEARRCGEIVRDMLRFASDQPTVKKRVPIDEILERIRQSLRRAEQESGATLTLQFEGDSPLVRVSPIEIEQAVTNLIDNAIRSREHGAKVRIERRTEGDAVLISILDNGCGIAADRIDRVLDPFYTSRLEAGGTGLGLSVAHGIAREHGGDLEIKSEPGVGTSTVLTLPIASDPETPLGDAR